MAYLEENRLRRDPDIKVPLMDFALERQFVDPYHSGRPAADKIVEGVTVQEALAITVSGEMLRPFNVTYKCCCSIVIIKPLKEDVISCLGAKICLDFYSPKCITDTGIMK